MSEIVPAYLAVQSMRDNGYKNAAYAIAELLDNSIQARATRVELICAEHKEFVRQRERSRVHQIAVLDNGVGMSAKTLELALQFGNGTNLNLEDSQGIGRFGMGLPSASISQCTLVEVWSWQTGIESALYTFLDLNKIRAKEQTSIPFPILHPIPELWRKASGNFAISGTLVVWKNLDRLQWKTSRAIFDNSEFIIGRMYRKFLADKRVSIPFITFDIDNPISSREETCARPNDPNYQLVGTSCPAPYNDKPMFQSWGEPKTYNVEFEHSNHVVTVKYYFANEEARSTPNAGSTDYGKHAGRNIGISMVRAERELELDTSWAIQYDPVERWWGIEVDFPPALDELFGVTNNKQSARYFAELAKMDVNSFLNGKSTTEKFDDLRDEDDPRFPIIKIAADIQNTLKQLRKLLTQQTKGNRSVKEQRYTDYSVEKVATAATRSLQHEGSRGRSDKDELQPDAAREATIEQGLIDDGVRADEAHEIAQSVVAEKLKFLPIIHSEIESSAFFSVRNRAGTLAVTLNTAHPAYSRLFKVLASTEQSNDPEVLRERLAQATHAIELLLTAWARYEDEEMDDKRRTALQDTRVDWGRMARRFLEGD